MPVPSVARGDSLALVVMRLPRWHAGSLWQNRLGAVQRLHLALFIHTQHETI